MIEVPLYVYLRPKGPLQGFGESQVSGVQVYDSGCGVRVSTKRRGLVRRARGMPVSTNTLYLPSERILDRLFSLRCQLLQLICDHVESEHFLTDFVIKQVLRTHQKILRPRREKVN
jgi:hypothetical protein